MSRKRPLKITLIFYHSINSFQNKAVEKYHCFPRQVHKKRHEVVMYYDNVACIQFAQYVYSKYKDNFFIPHL